MKKPAHLKLLALVTLGLLTVWPAASAHAAKGKAVVRAVRGSAQATEKEKTLPLKAGRVLRAGATITTGPGGVVDLFLGVNGPVLRVCEDSVLKFATLSYKPGAADEPSDIHTELVLESGRIAAVVRKLTDRSKFSIKTPTYVVAAPGPLFCMDTRGVQGLAGMLTVTNKNTSTFRVQPGQTFTDRDGLEKSAKPESAVTPSSPESEAQAVRHLVEAATVALPVQPHVLQDVISMLAIVKAACSAATEGDTKVSADRKLAAATAARTVVSATLQVAKQTSDRAVAEKLKGASKIASTVENIAAHADTLIGDALGVALAAVQPYFQRPPRSE